MAVRATEVPLLQHDEAPTERQSTAATVLVVDDEEMNRDMLSRRLLKAGHDVVIAADGHEALAYTDSMQIDLVLLDVMMPGLSGFAVLERLRRAHSADDLPVILVTARTDSKDVVEGLKLGANDYVPKPIDFAVLRARIDTQLQLLAAQSVLRRSKQDLEHLVEQRTVQLRASQERFRTLYDNNPSIFLTVSKNFDIVSANAFGLDHLGFSRDELMDMPCAVLFPNLEPKASDHLFKRCTGAPGRVFRWETTMIRKASEPIQVNVSARGITEEDGEPAVLVVCEDTSEVHRLTSRLSFEMSHDNQTGLVNHRAFEELLNHAIIDEAAESDDPGNALFVIAIDRSGLVTDAMGRNVLDQQAVRVADVLKSQESERVTAARLDNDRLGLLCRQCSVTEAEAVASGILDAVRSIEFVWFDSRIDLTVSIGVAPFYSGDSTAAAVLREADLASDQALERGGDRYRLYRMSDDPITARRSDLIWLTRMKEALDNDKFRLYAQSIQALSDDERDAPHYEVLIRLLDDNGDAIAPGAFLPAVERYNLSAKLDRWVVETLLRRLADNREHVDDLGLCSVNLSGPSIGNPELLDFLLHEIPASGIEAAKFCFEITETAAIANLPAAIEFINALRDLGCRFALDDFGSGLSSFAYLRDLPVDFVKIDGEFVKDIAENSVHRAMVRSINDIAHIMGKKTIAEFVETSEAVAELRRIGVDYVQGYFIDKPSPLDARLAG